MVNRPNNCDFVGKSRTARPTFPGPRICGELRVIFCLNFSDGPSENPEDREKSDEASDFLMVFHGTVALIEFTSRSFHVKMQTEPKPQSKKTRL
jgi:hypothetical protein